MGERAQGHEVQFSLEGAEPLLWTANRASGSAGTKIAVTDRRSVASGSIKLRESIAPFSLAVLHCVTKHSEQ